MSHCLIIALSITLTLATASCRKEPLPADEWFVFTDERDQHEYMALKIGDETWMIENLSYLPEVVGAATGGFDEARYYVFGYEGTDTAEARMTESYGAFGVLYNWKAAMGACPDGWQLPSDEDWKKLEALLGMDSTELDETDWRNTGGVGAKLKSDSGWNNDGQGSNSSGFNVVPGSLRNKTGSFGEPGESAHFWSSTPAGSSVEFGRALSSSSDGIARNSYAKNYGLSIRCVKKWGN